MQEDGINVLNVEKLPAWHTKKKQEPAEKLYFV